MRRVRPVLLACAASLIAAAPAHALELGFNSDDLFRAPNTAGQGADDAGMAAGLANAHGAGASVWRFALLWHNVAPERPPSDADAANPDWPGYRWEQTDRTVRAIAAAGLDPLPFIYRAPAWAEGAGRPPATQFVPAGTWRPDAAAFGAFAKALATRYGGKHPDPLLPGQTLPQISSWQGWNEPNLYVYLTPQYVQSGGGWQLEAPRLFRDLLNAFYDGIKSVNPAATVVAGATAPYGDYPAGGHRIPPAHFMRELLCVDAATLAARPGCPQVRFDAYAHNPYTGFAPTRRALNADDVAVPDLGKLQVVVRRATQRGTIRPKATVKPLWITELSWDTTPDPRGFSPETQARYMAGAITTMAREGAERIYFWNLRDDAPVPSWDATYQSGIFARGASPAQDVAKPSYSAFRFPFTAYRGAQSTRVWGKAPAGRARVTVQRRSGDAWRTVTRVRAGVDGVFVARVRVPRGAQLRAVQGSEISRPWSSR